MGFGMPGEVWAPQVDELQKDHRCCHYDHLGVGDSDRGPLFRTMPEMAEDALRILDELRWVRAHKDCCFFVPGGSIQVPKLEAIDLCFIGEYERFYP